MELRVGPVDTVVAWVALPNLGLDWRSQFELLRNMPGGLDGLWYLGQQLAARPYPVLLMLGLLPWDDGTQAETSGQDFASTAGELLYNCTLGGAVFRDAAYVPPAAASYNNTGTGQAWFGVAQTDAALQYEQPADASNPTALEYTLSTYAMPTSRGDIIGAPCTAAQSAPDKELSTRSNPAFRSAVNSHTTAAAAAAAQGSVSAYRWLERRHMPVFGDPWARSRAADVLAAFTNGGGVGLWENVWGFFNKLTDADAALALRTTAVLRFMAPLLLQQLPQAEHPGAANVRARRQQPRLRRRPAVSDSSVAAGSTEETSTWAPSLPSSSTAVVVSEFFALCPEYLSAAAAPHSPGAFSAAAAPANCTLFVFANPSAEQQTGVTLNVSAALGRVALPQDLHWLDVYSGLVISGPAPVQQLRGGLGGGFGFPPESPRSALLHSLARAQAAGREGSGSAHVATTPNSGFSASLAADILTFSMEPGGAGAVLVTPNSPGAELAEFLTIMNNISALPLSSFSAAWYPRNQSMAPVPTPPGAVAQPPGMLLVPGAIGYAFTVAAALPEMFSRPDAAAAAAGPGVDVQYPWEAVPAASHAVVLDIAPFYMDAHPVTNADYQGFAWATGYNSSGINPTNYLRHWTVALPNGTRTYNASNGDGPRPVTWVSRADAQAFCSWAGKRLPTEVEWQFAAQATGASGPGTDYRLNPWGNQSCAAVPGACPPQGDTPATLSPPVGQFPAGNSALGISDLAGSVWQMTDAFSDGATNAVVLRGGSRYQAQDALSAAAGLPSRYVQGQIDLNHHLRVPLVDDSTLRSAFVGFRCMTGTAFAADQDK